MSNDIARLKTEIARLHAESLATQTILVKLMVALAESGKVEKSILTGAFDDAADFVEALAIALGTKAAPEQTVGALKVVEQLRTAFVNH